MNVEQLEVNETLLAERVGEEMVLVEPESGQYFQLNVVATRMFEMILSGDSETEIVKQIGKEFEAETQIIHTDLIKLVDSLLERGLMRTSAGQS